MAMKKRTLIWLLALMCFLLALSRLNTGRRAEGAAQLEQAVRRCAVSCYAQEGFYPPNLQYLAEHYALRYDESQYIVHYEAVASNLMPDITVVEKE